MNKNKKFSSYSKNFFANKILRTLLISFAIKSECTIVSFWDWVNNGISLVIFESWMFVVSNWTLVKFCSWIFWIVEMDWTGLLFISANKKNKYY